MIEQEGEEKSKRSEKDKKRREKDNFTLSQFSSMSMPPQSENETVFSSRVHVIER